MGEVGCQYVAVSLFDTKPLLGPASAISPQMHSEYSPLTLHRVQNNSWPLANSDHFSKMANQNFRMVHSLVHMANQIHEECGKINGQTFQISNFALCLHGLHFLHFWNE